MVETGGFWTLNGMAWSVHANTTRGRTALDDRRAQYLSMHRTGSRVLAWVAHSDFLFFSCLFIFFMSCSISMKIFSARWWETEPTGSLCQMVHTAWEPPVKSACCCTARGEKEKRRLGSDFERQELEARMMTRVFRHCAMRVCAQANREASRGPWPLIPLLGFARMVFSRL